MPKAKSAPKRNTDQIQLMAARGYLSPEQVARSLGLKAQAIRLWVSKGQVKSIRVAGHLYLEEKSVVAHVGEEAAKLLQLT
jgi:hypothetical protein